MVTPADAQITAQARLRQIVVRAVENAWTGLRSYDAPDVARFLAVVVPIILAAQRQAVTLSDAYVARMLGRAPLGIDASSVIAGVRGDVTPETVYRRPFVTVWSELADGKPYLDAVAAGEQRASASAALDVQLAQRGGLQAVQEADGSIRGWSRKADPGACDYCRLLDGAKVKRADVMPIHPACGCSLEPWTSHFAVDPLPDGVVVWDHGEYGATVGSAEHDHLTEREALVR